MCPWSQKASRYTEASYERLLECPDTILVQRISSALQRDCRKPQKPRHRQGITGLTVTAGSVHLIKAGRTGWSPEYNFFSISTTVIFSVSKTNRLSGSQSSMIFCNLPMEPLSFLNNYMFSIQHLWDLDVQFSSEVWAVETSGFSLDASITWWHPNHTRKYLIFPTVFISIC